MGVPPDDDDDDDDDDGQKWIKPQMFGRRPAMVADPSPQTDDPEPARVRSRSGKDYHHARRVDGRRLNY